MSIPFDLMHFIILTHQDRDHIEGNEGNDDLIGGHEKRHGEDTGDYIDGGSGADCVLGENGQILREVASYDTTFPWIVHMWKAYPLPFNSEPIRDIRRYDDIDNVSG